MRKVFSVLIELGLFNGDELLHRKSIKVTEQEALYHDSDVSIKYQLIKDVAEIELRVFRDGQQLIKSNLRMPIHESEDWESIELDKYTLAFKCRLDA